MLFHLTSRRCEHRPLLISIDLPVNRVDRVYPNASFTVAFIDRLTGQIESFVIERAPPKRVGNLSLDRKDDCGNEKCTLLQGRTGCGPCQCARLSQPRRPCLQ